MSKEYELFPYRGIGELFFGMTREEIQRLLGKPISSNKYGFPIQDRILDDYGFFYTLFNNQMTLEAVEFFPEYTKEKIVCIFGDVSIQSTADRETTLEALKKVTDDIVKDEDESEGYYSQKLGVKLFYPDDEDNVVTLIVHDLHCYDEEEQYLKDLENGVE